MVVIPAKDLMNYIPKPHKRSICGKKKILSIYVFYTPSLLIQEKEKEGEKKNSRLCNPVPTTSPPVPVQEMLVQPQTQNEFSATTSGIRGKKQLNVLWLLII